MCAKIKNDISDLTVVGIDIGKDVFHLVGFDAKGTLVLRQKINRFALVPTFEKFRSCIVGMEACQTHDQGPVWRVSA